MAATLLLTAIYVEDANETFLAPILQIAFWVAGQIWSSQSVSCTSIESHPPPHLISCMQGITISDTTSQWDAKEADMSLKAKLLRQSPGEHCLSLLVSSIVTHRGKYTHGHSVWVNPDGSDSYLIEMDTRELGKHPFLMQLLSLLLLWQICSGRMLNFDCLVATRCPCVELPALK